MSHPLTKVALVSFRPARNELELDLNIIIVARNYMIIKMMASGIFQFSCISLDETMH